MSRSNYQTVRSPVVPEGLVSKWPANGRISAQPSYCGTATKQTRKPRETSSSSGAFLQYTRIPATLPDS